jgi:cell division transport system permease protein
MSIPANLFATAFREQRLGLMFAVLVAVMVYIASLAVAAEGALALFTSGWSMNVHSRLTVEVPFPEGNAPSQGKRVKKISDFLQSLPDVAQVSPLSEGDIARLLKPWVVDASALASLPLPTLIDVDVKEGATLDADALRQKLSASISDVRVSSHAEGLEHLVRLVDSFRLLGGLMIALTALILVIAISLICRAAMAVQHDTIELLHFMGATDSDIAKQFLYHARRLSLPASLLGFVLAAATTAVLLTFLRSFWGQPLILGLAWLAPGVMMALVPLAAFFVAHAVARFSVLSLLRGMS